MEPYYQTDGKQTTRIIRKALTREEYRGFLKGNIIKYRLRVHEENSNVYYCIKKASDSEQLLMEAKSGK